MHRQKNSNILFKERYGMKGRAARLDGRGWEGYMVLGRRLLDRVNRETLFTDKVCQRLDWLS
jgi:hypothetical protein